MPIMIILFILLRILFFNWKNAPLPGQGFLDREAAR
jgi:hypothetical protein